MNDWRTRGFRCKTSSPMMRSRKDDAVPMAPRNDEIVRSVRMFHFSGFWEILTLS